MRSNLSVDKLGVVLRDSTQFITEEPLLTTVIHFLMLLELAEKSEEVRASPHPHWTSGHVPKKS